MARTTRLLALFGSSVLLAAGLDAAGLAAAFLVGPMAASIWFASRGDAVEPVEPAFQAAQALVGLLIAPSLKPEMLVSVARQLTLFLGVTVATLVVSAGIGWLLARKGVLPGSAAVWGSMPGAATAMVLMARDDQADWRLVAVLSYLRVVCVAVVASIIALATTGHAHAPPPGGEWLPRIRWLALAETVAIGAVGTLAARYARLPAAAFLGPMILGAALEGAHLADPQLPAWLLVPAYLVIGWKIGAGFTPPILDATKAAAPGRLLATAALLAACAGIGEIVARVTDQGFTTVYLATSPGGADSVAIIAASTPVDVGFVMTLQMLRFIAVLASGPALARLLARRFGDRDR